MSPHFRPRPLVGPPFVVTPVLLALAATACQTLETETPTPIMAVPDGGSPTGGAGAGGDGQTGGSGPSGGTGGSGPGGGTGGSGTGGSGTGGSGTGGSGGELPPPPPGCEPLAVTASAVDHTALSRAGAVEIRYTAPEGARIEGVSAEGGLFTLQRSGKLYYSPGGSINGDAELRAPWTTGPVHVTVRATDANGCRGEATTTVQVDGDLIVSDAPSGSLYIMGSDGRVIGQWRGGWPRGADALLRLPAEAGGGFVLGVPGYDDEDPRIERIESADPGADVEFEMQNRSGVALYPDDEGPRSLIFDPNGDDGRGEILGDNAPNGVVHRWTLDGSYNGVYAFGAAGGGNGPVSMGFARLSDGRIVYGLRDQRDVYVIGGGTVDSFLRYEVVAECLGQGHGGTVVICGSDSPYMIWTRFGAQANLVDRFAGPQIYAPRMVGPFREGYLRTDPSGFWMTYHAANLTEPEDTSDLWAQDDQARNGLEYPRAFVWLGP